MSRACEHITPSCRFDFTYATFERRVCMDVFLEASFNRRKINGDFIASKWQSTNENLQEHSL